MLICVTRFKLSVQTWKGGGDPADTPAIEKELKLAKAALNRAIAECVK